MNRTTAFLATAAGLALIAVVLGLPHRPAQPAPTPTPTRVEPTVRPTPVEPTQAPIAEGVRTDGSIRMEGRLSHPFIAPGRSDLFVTVELTGEAVPGARRAPVNIALVIDRSGSMSGFKLERAKAAARKLISLLEDEDRLAIVHYGSGVKALPSLPATPENRARMTRYVNAIWDDGGTNIGAGLNAGRDQLLRALESEGADRRVQRLILISDGEPTEGVTSERGLAGIVGRIRESGVTVSAIGVGDDFNEDLMQRLAEVGSGSYGYIQDASRLATVFERDLKQAATQVARDVSLRFELPPGVELGDVLGYRFDRSGSRVEVSLPDFSAGQVEKVVVRLAANAGAVGTSMDITGLALSYTDLLRSGPVASRAQLAAMVTARREEVLARRDKQAVLHATRALSGQNFRRAAESIAKGDTARANTFLRDNVTLFEDAETLTGADALASDRKDNDYAFGLVQGAPSAPAPAMKELKRRALIGTGRGSVY